MDAANPPEQRREVGAVHEPTGADVLRTQQRTSDICVDRCVCFHRSFEELKAVAERTGAKSLEALLEETEFGISCRTCNPYVRRMLLTGETVFFELIEEDDG